MRKKAMAVLLATMSVIGACADASTDESAPGRRVQIPQPRVLRKKHWGSSRTRLTALVTPYPHRSPLRS